MYEQMKNEFMKQLMTKCNFNNGDIQEIVKCLDLTSLNYDVKKKETQIVPYNHELPEIVKTFIVCKSVEGYAKGTLYNYTKILTNFFFALQKAPEQVTTNDIRTYLYLYQKERGISNRSLDKVRDNISAFYNWLYNEGYISKNPCASIPRIKYEQKPKTHCTQVELEYLRKSCETLKQKAILEVLYSTGCRVGELVILKKEDIDWSTNSVHLFGKGQKHRTSFLNAKAEVALKEYLNSRTDDREWLFVSDRSPHNQMHTCGIQKIIRCICQRANCSIDKNVTPHTLRHTCATRMVENNSDLVSVQRILGHSNINTTMTYVHTTLENVKYEHSKAII